MKEYFNKYGIDKGMDEITWRPMQHLICCCSILQYTFLSWCP